MPQVGPKTLPGLVEIGRNPVLRRGRAEEERRLGGIEGVGPTPTSVRTEQADAARLTRRSPAAPASRPSPPRTDDVLGWTLAVTLPGNGDRGVSG